MFQFEFSYYDGKDIQKLVVDGLPEVADEVHRLAVKAQAKGLCIQGIVLGPEEYLGILGFLAHERMYASQSHVSEIGGIKDFMGFAIHLKDTPGVDLLFQNEVGMAARLTHLLPKFSIKSK